MVGASDSRGTVLLTGSTGFTGRWVRTELEQAGYRVVGLSHRGGNEGDERSIDLQEAGALRALVAEIAPSFVLHLGAITFVPHGDPFEIYRVNLFGTLNLLDALVALPRGPERVIVASSANVYGNPTTELIVETAAPAPVNHYATSKLAMEHMVRTYADRLPLVITRPFNYTGRGQAGHFVVPKIVAHFAARAGHIELGNVDVERDFSDVRDVARFYRRLLESPDAEGETVNIGSGASFGLRFVIDHLRGLTGHDLEIRVNPAFVRANEIKRLRGDTSKLDSLVGPHARIPFAETIAWMLDEERPTTHVSP